MEKSWQAYLAAPDQQAVQELALEALDRAQTEPDPQKAADLQVTSRLYLVQWELDHSGQMGCPVALQALDLIPQEILDDCSPEWRSQAMHLRGRVMMRSGDYAEAAVAFQEAAQIREETSCGSDIAPRLYNSASSAALLAGASEWACWLACQSLRHLQANQWILEHPDGEKDRRQAARCLNQSLGLEPHGVARNRWQRRKRED